MGHNRSIDSNPAAAGAAPSGASKNEALHLAVEDAQRRLGHLLQAPASPETAAMLTLLITKVLDLRAEIFAKPRVAWKPGDPIQFDEI